MDVSALSDVELRESLKQYGITVGPIVASTRKVYEKKLMKFINSKDANNSAVNDSALFSSAPATPNGTESKVRASSTPSKSPKSPVKASPVQATPEVHNQSDSDDCEESMRYLTEEEMAADRAALAARKNKGNGICGRALSFAVMFVAIAVFAYFLIENAEQLKRLTETQPSDDSV